MKKTINIEQVREDLKNFIGRYVTVIYNLRNNVNSNLYIRNFDIDFFEEEYNKELNVYTPATIILCNEAIIGGTSVEIDVEERNINDFEFEADEVSLRAIIKLDDIDIELNSRIDNDGEEE